MVWAETQEPRSREGRDARFSAFRKALVCFSGATFSDGSTCTEEVLNKLYDSAVAADGTIALLADHDWNIDNIFGYAEEWQKTDDGKLYAVFSMTDETAAAVDNGRYKNLSIAFSMPEYKIEEVSIVAVPQIRGAAFLAEKEADMTETEQETEAPAVEETKTTEETEKIEVSEEIVANSPIFNKMLASVKNQVIRLQDEVNALRQRERYNLRLSEAESAFSSLVKNGKAIEANRQIITEFAMSLSDTKAADFFEVLNPMGGGFGGAQISRPGTDKKAQAEAESADVLKKFNALKGRA